MKTPKVISTSEMITLATWSRGRSPSISRYAPSGITTGAIVCTAATLRGGQAAFGPAGRANDQRAVGRRDSSETRVAIVSRASRISTVRSMSPSSSSAACRRAAGNRTTNVQREGGSGALASRLDAPALDGAASSPGPATPSPRRRGW